MAVTSVKRETSKPIHPAYRPTRKFSGKQKVAITASA